MSQTRPCDCNRVRPGEPFDPALDCRACYLWATDSRYRNLWGDPGTVPPCPHQGAPTGGVVECLPCGGRTRLKLFGCALHGVCTTHQQAPGIACCQACTDRRGDDPFDGPPVRDLAYHVYPLRDHGGYVWRRRVAQLLDHVSLFNGRRVVGVAVDARTDHAGEIREAFRGEVDAKDFVVVPNDPGRWECTTLLPLLARLETREHDRCLLWAHAKGVTHPPDHVTQHWADALATVMLSRWPDVEAQLVRYRVTGAFRWKTRMWPKNSRADWFYSGSWVWYRSKCLFSRNWREVDNFKWAVEAYAPIKFSYEESGCLFGDEAGSVYDAGQWWRRWWPELAVWLKGGQPCSTSSR
jgi:hypothetical protein